jgi:hypothetical protein
MADEKKCAHTSCLCTVPAQEKYCSDYCHDAQDVHDTEIQCDCKHPPCAL